MIPMTEGNRANIETLNQLTEDLKVAIRSSTKKCCCCKFDNIIFGRLDQAKLILAETFEGKHFYVNGPTGSKIDCMFFPCTNKETVTIDYNPSGARTPGSSKNSNSRSNRNSINNSHSRVTEPGYD